MPNRYHIAVIKAYHTFRLQLQLLHCRALKYVNGEIKGGCQATKCYIQSHSSFRYGLLEHDIPTTFGNVSTFVCRANVPGRMRTGKPHSLV